MARVSRRHKFVTYSDRLTQEEMIEELRARLGGRSMAACAREWGVERQEIWAVIKHLQYPSAQLLAVLGLKEESKVMYVRVGGGRG